MEGTKSISGYLAYYKTKIQNQQEEMDKLKKENSALKTGKIALENEIRDLETKLDAANKKRSKENEKYRNVQEKYEFLTTSLYENEFILCEYSLNSRKITFRNSSSSFNRHNFTQ